MTYKIFNMNTCIRVADGKELTFLEFDGSNTPEIQELFRGTNLSDREVIVTNKTGNSLEIEIWGDTGKYSTTLAFNGDHIINDDGFPFVVSRSKFNEYYFYMPQWDEKNSLGEEQERAWEIEKLQESFGYRSSFKEIDEFLQQQGSLTHIPLESDEYNDEEWSEDYMDSLMTVVLTEHFSLDDLCNLQEVLSDYDLSAEFYVGADENYNFVPRLRFLIISDPFDEVVFEVIVGDALVIDEDDSLISIIRGKMDPGEFS